MKPLKQPKATFTTPTANCIVFVEDRLPALGHLDIEGKKIELIWDSTRLEISLKVFYTNKVAVFFFRSPLANGSLHQNFLAQFPLCFSIRGHSYSSLQGACRSTEFDVRYFQVS